MKTLKGSVRVFAFLVTALVLASGLAWGQEATGRIAGTITDPNGGVMPDVKVTVTNTATQFSRETTTDREGFYQVLSLNIGTYKIVAERAGFRKVAVENQTLLINQVLRIDMQMEIGAPTEVIEVNAQIAGVETVNHTLGQSVTLRPLLNMPLNGRNVYDLALLQPGVTETNPGSPGLFSIAGGRADSVTFLLDGGVNNNLLSNLVVFTPNPDTIAEFRILTSNYTAEYGRNAGGVVSAVTKSGTNDYHGSVFEFLRNDALNANTFFNNRDGRPREILKRNQFGGTIGGPISIPKLLSGKDRFFFFTSYQGQRLVNTQTSSAVTVFTPGELNGDFSRSGPGGTPDDGVVCFLTGNHVGGSRCQDSKGNNLPFFPFFQPNAALAGRAIIDPTRINSVPQKYIRNNLVPSSPSGQLISQGTRTDRRDELTLKFDAVITPKDKLAVTLGGNRNPNFRPFSTLDPSTFSPNVSGYPVTVNIRNYFSNIAYTRTFSPTLLNEFRFTTQRNNQLNAVPARQLPTVKDLGIGVIPDNPTGPSRLSFNKGLIMGFSPQGPTNLVDNTFAWSDTLSWTRGKHNWKFGFTYSPYQNNTVFDFHINGTFVFSGSAGGIGTGNDFADFLLGLPDEYFQFGEAPSDIRSKAYYTFAQDEWHLRKNLILTLGIRYEYSQPKIDTKGRAFSLNLGQTSSVFPNAPLGLLFPGDPQAPFGANFPDRNDWAPRFGFAWDPRSDGRTSIRGGIGLFYDILKGEDNLQFNGQAPFFGFSDFNFNPLTNNPAQEVNYMTQPYVATGSANPFPSRPPAPTINFRTSGFLPFGGTGVFFVDPHLRTPYTYQYNLSVQHELVKNLTLEGNYVGSSSHKLTDLVDANPFILGDPRNIRLFNATPGNSNCTATTAAACSLSFLDEFRNVTTASYNSLEASLQKRSSDTRFFGTTYFSFAYTYAHGIDNGSGFRQGSSSRVPFYNRQQFRGSTDFDIRHRITFSGGWDLPLERAWSSGPRRLTKGWGLYTIVTYRAGFPLDVAARLARRGTRPGPSGAGDGNLVRANLVGSSVVSFDPHLSQTITVSGKPSTGNFFFDPNNFSRAGLDAICLACATNPALRTYGTLPRNFFSGPGRTNVNFAIVKTTPISQERVNLLFRAELFNLFNHTQFDNPSVNIVSALFGQVTSTVPDSQRIIQLALKLTF